MEPDVLKELGWTEEDVQKFTERLKGQLAADKQAETPEEIARRRQFEEMLKSLDFSGRTEHRQSSQRTGDDVGGVGPRKIPVPPQYRELYEAYTRSLSKRSAAPAPTTRD